MNKKNIAANQEVQGTKAASIPPDKTLITTPVFSCIALIDEPCFPIKLIACVDATNKRIEQNATPAAPDIVLLSSVSDNPDIRLKILRIASIAGESGASKSSFPDIST